MINIKMGKKYEKIKGLVLDVQCLNNRVSKEEKKGSGREKNHKPNKSEKIFRTEWHQFWD